MRQSIIQDPLFHHFFIFNFNFIFLFILFDYLHFYFVTTVYNAVSGSVPIDPVFWHHQQ